MSKGKVLRVIIGGRGYDLTGAFAKATTRDWAALIGATGRNPFTVAQSMQSMSKLSEGQTGMEALAGPEGAIVVDVITDLVFLARRLEGDKSTADPARPITYDEVAENLPFMEALGATSQLAAQQAAEAAQPEPADPTPAQTGSDLGDGNEPHGTGSSTSPTT